MKVREEDGGEMLITIADKQKCSVPFIYLFGVLGIEFKGILLLSYTPSPILFFILKQSLAKLQRLASNLQSSYLSLPRTGITGARHHTGLIIGSKPASAT